MEAKNKFILMKPLHKKGREFVILNRLTSRENQEEWLRIRKHYLTGTDAGAVCGLNPYKSSMQVYLDKISPEIETVDNEAMRLGRDLEDYVASRFMEASGKKVRRVNAMYVNDQNPFMLANVDRLVVGERAGLECKTSSPYSSDRWKDGGMPEWYYLQCQHYIKTLEMEGWYLAVLILGKGFQYTYIKRDEELLQYLVSIEKDFWENRVMARVMPSPDGSKGADELIQKYFGNRGGIIRLNGFDEQIARRNELAGLVKKMQTEQKAIEQELKLYLGKEQAQVGVSDHYRVTWTEFETRRIDTERLKREQPEIYKNYSKIQKSSRFSIQAA